MKNVMLSLLPRGYFQCRAFVVGSTDAEVEAIEKGGATDSERIRQLRSKLVPLFIALRDAVPAGRC